MATLPPIPKGWSAVPQGPQGPPEDAAPVAQGAAAPPTPSPMDRLRSFEDVIGKGAGAALGALDNTSFGRWLNRESLGSNEANRESAAYNKLIAPHTPGQETAAKVGHFAGAAVPSLAAGALTGGLADVPEAIGGGSQLLRLGAKAALEAGAQGGASKLSGGKFSTGAEAGAALPVAGAALRPVGRFLTERAPGFAIQSMLRLPVRTMSHYGPEGLRIDPAQAIANEGIVARNLESLQAKTAAAAGRYGAQADEALAAPGIARATTDIRPLIRRPFARAARGMIEKTPEERRAARGLAENIIRNLGGETETELSLPTEAAAAKRALQQRVAQLGGYGRNAASPDAAPTVGAMRAAASGIRKSLAKISPDYAAAEAREAPLRVAVPGIKDAIARRAARGFNLTSPDFAALIGSGLAGGGVGAAMPARTPEERLAHIAEFIAGERALFSPLGATLAAQGLRRAPQIASGAGQLARAGYIAYKAKP